MLDNVDFEELYAKLLAFTTNLLEKRRWYHGVRDTGLKGKQAHDYVMGAIERLLRNPEKYRPETGVSLEDWLKWQVIRGLVGADVRSSENQTSTSASSLISDELAIEAENSELIASALDSHIDFDTIASMIEKEISDDKECQEIFAGLSMGLKRREIIQECNFTPGQYNNGIRRLKTVMKSVAEKYQSNLARI